LVINLQCSGSRGRQLSLAVLPHSRVTSKNSKDHFEGDACDSIFEGGRVAEAIRIRYGGISYKTEVKHGERQGYMTWPHASE